MEQIIPLLLEHGLLGVICVVLGLWGWSKEKENKELQKEIRETLRESFGVVNALQSALRYIEGGKL